MKPSRPFGFTRLAASAMLALAGTALTAPAAAEDIDIYGSQAAPGSSNLMLLLDNTSNWSANNQAWNRTSVYNKCIASSGMTTTSCSSLVDTVFGSDTSLKQGQVQLRALKYVLNEMVCNTGSTVRVNVGVAMLGSQTVRSSGDSNGFIRFKVQPLTGTAATSGSSCQRLLASLTEIDNRITDPAFKAPSNADYSAPLYEIFKYFGGYSNPTLANASPTNPSAGSPIGAQGYGQERYSRSNTIEDAEAFTDSNKTTYRSPLGACDNNILVLVGNGYPNTEPTAGPTRFQGLNYTPPALTSTSADTSRLADEWAYFLRNGDVSSLSGQQYVKTYTVNTYNTQENTSQTRLLKSMASVGGGGYFVVDGDLVKLKKAFEDIIARAAAVDSVFTATTLPVSTTTQGSYLNQLFIAMFRPDAEREPRWMGNLKQYELGLDELGEVRVMDAAGRRALVSGSGFFSPTAESFWSHSSVYFAQMPMGTPPTGSDSPDGLTVEKGGAAQVLRESNLQNASARRVFTMPATGATSGTALSTMPFSTSNTNLSGVFNANQTVNDTVINWARGENNITAEGVAHETAGSYLNASNEVTALGTTGARPSVHGDVLHSRPVALNYGGDDVVVYYGANDGFLRAVDGRKTGSGAGQELWSFVAPEHYPVLTRLYNNTPALHMPSTTSTGSEVPPVGTDAKKSYAMDGPIGVFARYTSSNTIQEAIIYAAMRRGGSAVYAFDVSSRSEPQLRFKISNTGAYSRLGQTWSMPRPVIFPAAAGAVFEDPIVVMGGGYDPAEDSNSSSGIGNVVYVINGRTGAKLAELATDYSVPGDVAVVDSNRDGVYDRGYAADVRGNLYRISMTNSAGTLLTPDNWTILKIASLDGKVFGAPDVVATRDFIAVMVGTGDREKPLLATTSDNFFLVKDTTLTQPDRGVVLTRSDLSLTATVNNTTYTLQAVNPDLNINNGCYIRLSTAGEKVVNSPFTIAGVTYFGTNRPTAYDEQSCSANLGQARAYRFSLFCGQAASTVLAGGGMPPSPVGGFVTMTAGGSRELVPFIIGGGGGASDGGSQGGGGGDGGALESRRPPGSVAPVRKRQYYRIHNNNR